MPDAWSLDAWLDAARLIRSLYLELLGRDILGDPEALANWLHHMREGGHGEAWLRERFMESEEYRSKHPDAPQPVPQPAPSPVPPPVSVGSVRLIEVARDNFVPRMYSYWPNAWVNGMVVHVFAGHTDGRPRFFRVSLEDGASLPWTPHGNMPNSGTTEGWYWDAAGWIYHVAGSTLRRVSPFGGQVETIFDVVDSHPGCDLWQPHSSDDGRVHSATVRRIVSDGAYPKIGTVAFRNGRQDFYPAQGVLDESQVTSDGKFLVIKEDDDNRVINLETRETRLLKDADGAVGHSDVGPSFVVGEDNHRGACVFWDLTLPLVPERKRVLFDTWNMGHVSYRAGRLLNSSPTHLNLVALDGSGVMPLVEHGNGGSPSANLSPCGRVACYISQGALKLLVLS